LQLVPLAAFARGRSSSRLAQPVNYLEDNEVKLTACLRGTSFALVLSCPTLAYAQTADNDDKGALPDVKETDHAGAGDTPTPPGGPPPNVRAPDEVDVAKNAGVGSDLAYASKSVVEVGGVLALRHQSETTLFRVSPSIGYFFVDNLELTLFPELIITRIGADDNVAGEGAQTDWSVGAVLEPSYHLPLNDRLLAFAGLGVGVNFAEDPGVDFLFRPRLGLDVLVGRSGILKPAAFMDVGVNDGLSSGGFEAGFTVMW
jgi:opacity protein-like surface antigen